MKITARVMKRACEIAAARRQKSAALYGLYESAAEKKAKAAENKAKAAKAKTDIASRTGGGVQKAVSDAGRAAALADRAQTRNALTGGAIGAGIGIPAGAILNYLRGGSALRGGLVGGGIGATGGALAGYAGLTPDILEAYNGVSDMRRADRDANNMLLTQQPEPVVPTRW